MVEIMVWMKAHQFRNCLFADVMQVKSKAVER